MATVIIYEEEKPNPWRKYPNERPTEYGKYEVYRAGCKKQHYETWNNTGGLITTAISLIGVKKYRQ